MQLAVIALAILGLAVGCDKDKEDEEEEEKAPTGVITTNQGTVSDDDNTPDDDPPVKDPDDDDDDDDDDDVVVVPPDAESLVVDCVGVECGATDATTYAGTGVGIWTYVNDTASVKQANVTLNGVNGTDMTLIVSNLTPGPVSLPDYAANNNTRAGRRAMASSNARAVEMPERLIVPFQPRYSVNPNMGDALMRRNGQRTELFPTAPTLLANVGDPRDFYHEDDSLRSTTLKQVELTDDLQTIQVWVEDSEYGDVTDAMINTIATKFADGPNSIYSMVTEVAGAQWGAHGSPFYIDPSQPIDIVLLNFDNNNLPYGTVGYFWARNNVKVDYEPFSNESISFYLDTETLYLASNPANALKFEISALAHEFVHMINFYQRFILIGSTYAFDPWMEEMSAMMMEDVVSARVDPTYNAFREDRFPSWLNRSTFNCALLDFQASSQECFGYDVAGSFGAHLLRHFGVAFYQTLLGANSSTDSAVLLDGLLVTAGSSLKDEVRRWGVASALIPADEAPIGFGMPEITEMGHTLPALDQPYYSGIREFPADGDDLQPLGHFPMSRLPTADTYVELVDVPPGASLTVVVQ